MSWSLGAQQALVPASLSDSTRSLRSNKLFLSPLVDVKSFWAISSSSRAFIVLLWHQTLVQPCAQQDCIAYKNLQASNLHAIRMNGVHHRYFCGA